MYRQLAIKMINDMFIMPKIAEYETQKFVNSNNKEMVNQYQKNIEIMGDLSEYLQEYLA